MGNSESTQSVNESEQTKTDDEPRWNEIEHENLLLEQLPAEVKTLPEEQKKATQTEETMEEFKNQLANKRLARQTALQEMREEINNLKAENRRLRQGAAKENEETPKEQSELVPVKEVDEDDENPSSRSRHANIELANAQLALQLANADNLSLRGELDVVQRQVGTLKEVICCCKQMLNVKEEQCAQLKMKLTEIENSFSEREMKIMSNNLRQEYERQLVNIRQLRQLYEERQRVAAAEYENLQRLISIKKDELIAEQEKTKSFEERNQLLNKELETANEELSKLREECSEHKYEKRILKEQVGAVNLLFSQLVMGFNGEHNMNIDRLTEMLEENRDLLNEMTQAEGSCSDGATLPKLLFELVEQAAKSEQTEDNKPTPLTGEDEDKTDSVKPESSGRKLHRRRSGGTGTGTGTGSDGAAASLKSHEPEIMGKVPATAQEIIGNLPKVWKVLMELLSHHKIERVQFEELPPVVASTTKTVEGGGGGATGVTGAAGALGATAKAPELSVSKTYIKLKDLIMEKKSLVKETNRLKTLNCHLDNRLNEQEKRLSAVSLELTKTWHLVGKMQRQHRQLHTQEQILRYQLQQKRRLLSELKDELEYCRRKWALARAKNDESQELCNDWRREFARRKLEDANHSAESGYSDSGPQSDEDSSGVGVGAGAGAGAVAIEATSSSHCRRKHLRDQFEHTRKIKRMQSTSPGRQAAAAGEDLEESEEIVLRWNSAPPTCGWRDEPDEPEEQLPDEDIATTSRGAVAKIQHTSRSRQRGQLEAASSSSSSPGAANERIQKLEEQCKSLIQQVLETSGNRERLEIQLCRFQDEISPAQHAVPLDEFINRKRLERMTRASSAPATGSLTPREEEYTRKRSERLGRLEEESRQLLSRIKRTADRGHYLKKSLDRIRRAPSREGSFESNTEEESKEETKEESKEEVKEESKEECKKECMEETKREVKQESTEESKEESKAESKKESKAESKEETKDEVKQESKKETTESPVTIQEESYTSRRAARLQRLEQESQQLLKQLSRNSERGDTLVNRLDTLHEQSQRRETTPSVASISLTVEQRLEDIERVSANRAERLRRLEEQGNELIARLSNTSERGTAMINRIAEREANKRQEAEVLEQTEEATSSLDNNNIASSSFVPQELESQGAACCVTVTTTSTQLARKQSTGAIPKTSTKNKPLAQLCAAVRHEDAHKKRSTLEQEKVNKVASLEEDSLELMVQRLRAIPYPEEGEQQKEPKKEESRKEKELPKEEELKDEECNPEEIEDIELKDEETPKEEKPEKSEFKKGEREEKPKEEKSKKSDFKEEESEQNTPEEEEFPKEQLKEDNPQKEELKKEEPKKNKLKKEDDKESELKEEKSAEAKFEEQEPRKEESKEEQSTEQESKEEELTMKESLEDESKVNENKNSTSS